MKTLDQCNWKAYPITDIFTITATKSGIDRNKLTGESGDFPYITRTDNNNAWDSFIGHQPKYKMDSGNVISVGLDTQTAFYQPIPFYTGQNLQVFSNEHMNKHIAMFILPLLKIQLKKFNWGGNGATLGRLKRLHIMLPSTPEGTPDYTFMEEYMRQKEQTILAKYKAHVSNILDNQSVIGGGKSSNVNWKEFRLEDIFTIDPGVRLTAANMTMGKRPFIGATDSNNGITAFVDNTNKSLDSNVLGVNYNGSVVENFYHPYEAIFSDDVKRLHLKEVENNKYICLFIKQTLLKQKAKYQYGYKFNGERMKRQYIMLPSTPDGTPDFAYMDAYMRQVEAKQMQKLLARIS